MIEIEETENAPRAPEAYREVPDPDLKIIKDRPRLMENLGK
jgi:hypothetical protein